MSELQSAAEDAVRRIPLLRNIECKLEPLTGGLTNNSFRVDSTAGKFVLRLRAPYTALLTAASPATATVQATAARAGIAPEIVHADFAASIFLERYVAGSVWKPEDLLVVGNIDRLAKKIRELHCLPKGEADFDALATAARYEAVISQNSAERSFATHCLSMLQRDVSRRQFVCAHNDLVAGNIIDDGDLWIVDWEYACNNDPYFDLASVICSHDLDAKLQRLLLTHYLCREAQSLDTQALSEQMKVFDAIQWLWYAARQALQPSAQGAARMLLMQQRLLTSYS